MMFVMWWIDYYKIFFSSTDFFALMKENRKKKEMCSHFEAQKLYTDTDQYYYDLYFPLKK